MVNTMKIGVISDLHIDRYNNSKEYIHLFEDHLSDITVSKQLDLLLIAGDISNEFDMTVSFIRTIKKRTGIEVYFIPGNHDLWQKPLETSTHNILKAYEALPECLIKSPLVINRDWAIVGHPAWYDYTYSSGEYSQERLERRSFKGGTWQDKLHVDWGVPDPDISRKFSDVVEADLESVSDKNIIMMTHIVTHRRFSVPLPHRLFGYFNAFIGTSDFDELYHNYNIKYSIMGHIHFRHHFDEHDTTFLCPCLGYKREWRTADMGKEMAQALYTFHL